MKVVTNMTVIVDPGDDPHFISIAISITEDCVTEPDKIDLFAALCSKINQYGVVDSKTDTWYPSHQIRRIEYERCASS